MAPLHRVPVKSVTGVSQFGDSHNLLTNDILRPTSRVCLHLAKFIVENMKIRLNEVQCTSPELAAAANLDGDLCCSGTARLAVTIPQRSGKGRLYLQPLTKEQSTAGYKPLCISTPGDGHCSNEISGLQVQQLLNTLQHGTDDDDEMQLAAQTAQQLESRRCGRLNYAECESLMKTLVCWRFLTNIWNCSNCCGRTLTFLFYYQRSVYIGMQDICIIICTYHVSV